MSKNGKRLTIEPAPKQRLKKTARKKSLLAWLDSLPPARPDDRLPEIDDLPAGPFDL